MFPKPVLGVVLAALVYLTPAVAEAGTRIDNVVMNVDQSGRALAEVTNIGNAPLGYVVRAYRWSVVNGEDVLEPTQDFMAVPPSFQLAPGQSRQVRVGFRNPRPSPLERTYRLAVREVPTVTEGEGIALAYEHRLPVYIEPQGGAQPRNLRWSLAGQNLRVENLGNRRAVIERVTILRNGVPAQVIETRARATVLAQTWRQYPLPAGAVSGGSVQIRVHHLGSGSEDLIVNAN